MAKLTKVNTNGDNNSFVGCALTGVCASAASDYIKQVTLTDGDELSDGMMVVVTFANGNTAGSAPVPITIYSSDQVHYYSDSGMTVAFTLAPDGCYDLEYTGSGNAYTYVSYPVIQVGEIKAPACDSTGRISGGSLWYAGDDVLVLYTSGKFLVLRGKSAVVDRSGSIGSTAWYLIIKPVVLNTNLNIEVSDQYGGLLAICGNLAYDTACGGTYYSIKAKTILKGNWTSDAGTGSQKIGSVGIIGTDNAVCVSMDTYSKVCVTDKGGAAIGVYATTVAPTITRTVTQQT